MSLRTGVVCRAVWLLLNFVSCCNGIRVIVCLGSLWGHSVTVNDRCGAWQACALLSLLSAASNLYALWPVYAVWYWHCKSMYWPMIIVYVVRSTFYVRLCDLQWSNLIARVNCVRRAITIVG